MIRKLFQSTLEWTRCTGVRNGLICCHQSLSWKTPAQPSLGFRKFEDPRGLHDTIAGMRVEGEVGVQHNARDFRGSVQRDYLVTDSHLWVEEKLVGIGGEQSHAGFLGSNCQLFPFCPSRQGWTELVSPCLSLHDAGSRDQQHQVVSIEPHVRICNGSIWGAGRGYLPVPGSSQQGGSEKPSTAMAIFLQGGFLDHPSRNRG